MKLESAVVSVEDLSPFEGNPRRGDLSVLKESLDANGQYRPIVVNRRDMTILAGNHTWLAARELGWAEIAVSFVDVDEAAARRIVLVDNRSNDVAGYDDAALGELLQRIIDEDGTVQGTGFSDADVAELIAGLTAPAELKTDPDDAPPHRDSPPVSQLGDVWLLGPHRLVCGDSTDPEAIKRCLDGSAADMVWTDPPYGVSYVGGTSDALTIQNDDLDVAGLTAFLRAALSCAFDVCRPGAAWYVAAPSGPAFLAFATVLTELGVWRQTLAWVKDLFVLGRSDYHGRYEQILYGWVEGADPEPLPPAEPDVYLDRVAAVAYGWKPGAAHTPPPDRKQDNVWEFPKPKASREHPTMKPVALIEKAIRNSSRPGAVVLDPFAGSGSTLIACHQLSRSAALVELDPKYADVICRRYQLATGTLPVLEATGVEQDFSA